MKRSIVLFSIILAISSCEKTNDYPSLDNFRLTKILNFNNSTDLEPSGFVNLEYDESGNLIKESLYDFPNTLYTYREYDYENNVLTEKRIYDGQVGNLRLSTYRKYEYENKKLIKEELHSSDGSLKYTTHYEFVGDNLKTTYNENDELGIHHQYKYTYNDLNILILEERFMYDQQLEGFTKYFYDNNNRLTKSEIYDSMGTKIQNEENKYEGSKNVPFEVLIYGPNGELTQTKKLLYDNLDNCIETMFVDGQGGTHTLFKKKYNEKLLIEHIQYAPTWGFVEWYVTRYEYSKI
jgi:hypothetical protein